jgi:NADH:ubiquinone oxidoreductase subunit 3 (subunit A)
MDNQWLYIGLFLLVGVFIPTAAVVIPLIIAPRKPNPIKGSVYECGMETVGENWVQFKSQYYVFALAFLIFDVETVFLFPWALALGALPLFAVLEGVVFIAILMVGLTYVWRKGALEWA